MRIVVDAAGGDYGPEQSVRGAVMAAQNLGCRIILVGPEVQIQSELAKSLPDKQALTEFIAFRRDYMNYPVDKQIADLKRVGIVK